MISLISDDGVTNLWILKRNLPITSLSLGRWLMFLPDICECNTFCCLCEDWIDNFITDSSREMQYDLFTIKDAHLNLVLTTENKMAVRFFPATAGDLNWAAHCHDVRFLRVFHVVLMLEAIKCSMNTSDRHKHGWGTTQRRECILDELCYRFFTIFATNSWHLAHAIRYLHALIQEDPYIFNYNALCTLVRWYLTESYDKCSRMCLWRDVDMKRIIDEPEIVIIDYLRRCNRLLTNWLQFYNRYSLCHMP